MAPHFVGLVAIGFRGRAKVVTPQRTLRGSGVEWFTGARVLYWLQKSVKRIFRVFAR
jgi:hypothetical protein